MDQMELGPARQEELEEACALVRRVFGACVAPRFSPQGVAEFLRYAQAPAMADRLEQGNFVLLARRGGGIAGLVEVRGHAHVAFFFVDQDQQRGGVGRALLEMAVARCREADPGLARITVNASPNAYGAYRRFGFEPDGPEQEHNGIIHTPMHLDLA